MRTEDISEPVIMKQKPLVKPVLGRTQGFLRSAKPQMVKMAGAGASWPQRGN